MSYAAAFLVLKKWYIRPSLKTAGAITPAALDFHTCDILAMCYMYHLS